MTLLLKAADVRKLLPLADCMSAVEEAFRMLALGTAPPPAVLAVHTSRGSFHAKAGTLRLRREYFALKSNANMSENPRAGLPTIQGVVLLCDAENGRVLAIMDSSEITKLRTAAATGIAAKYLAHPGAATLTLCGCGAQADAQFSALAAVRALRRVFVHDVDRTRADEFVRRWSQRCGVSVEVAPTIGDAVRQSDIVVTCTTSKRHFIEREMVSPGTFIAAVGADSEGKQEIDPHLLAESRLVCDLTSQCAQIGELHHAVAAGLMTAGDVFAELGKIVAGAVSPQLSKDDLVVFDSTGIGIQDVAAAAVAYERAADTGGLASFDFAAAEEPAA